MSALAQTISSFCHKCQIYANIPRALPIALSILLAPWPFCQWGLDLIGKLPTAVGQFKYAIVAVDYQTKWVEADPLIAITTEKVKNFLWKNIYCRFGVPDTIVTDNGTQFDNDELRAYTENLGTRILYASLAHPQTNGQVEAVNKIIKKILKKNLDDANGLWASKLPEVLWAIRTTAIEATGETPFCMAFGFEAVLPIETQIPSARIEYFDAGTNEEGLQLDTNLLEERRDVAHMHKLVNKRRIARYYDAKVQSRTLKLGDWVMKQLYPEPRGLDPSSTGPYEIIEEVGPATFYIRDMDGVVSRHSWNTQRLHYYYR
ncbi:uncharacterized protein LOC133723274 [Rosa rugosa]|uniref:uncharacterized protein LOC133723274 n=1 Tax=Rosa rugosa TaxID=74645 RepID=UPI002B40CA0B|nr:uncharacterized protein LOC133723274 [Rosa rugosa]